METLSNARESIRRKLFNVWVDGRTRALKLLKSESGQGTTEYAILVGVLVVIAILAITVFRPRLQELWNAIADGVNSL